jgi:hypothetical protein
MSALIDLSFGPKEIEKLLASRNEKGWVNLTVAVSDRTTDRGQNVSAWVKQTKEEYASKAAKQYVGNGKVFYTDGRIAIAEKPDESPAAEVAKESYRDDLPF